MFFVIDNQSSHGPSVCAKQARRGLGYKPECPRCCRRVKAKPSRGGWLYCVADGCGARWRTNAIKAGAASLAQPKGHAQLDMFGEAVASCS